MKKIYLNSTLLIAIISLITIICMGATIRYTFTYDNSGNRIRRDTITVSLKSADSEIIAQENNDAEMNKEQIIVDKVDNFSVLIYPNPTKGIVKISIPDLDAKTNVVRLQVHTLQGVSIIDKKITGNTDEIDLSARPAGLYIVKLFVGDKQTVWKIIKE